MPQPSASGRLIALDVARACAVFGMIIVNVGPYTDEGPGGWLVRAFNGRASVLFVILAGIGVVLLARSSVRTGDRNWVVLLWRAALLLVMGLGLQLLDHNVNVILASYAGLFLFAILLLPLPHRWLLPAALTTAIAGPVLWLILHREFELATAAPQFGDSIPDVLTSLLVSGPYPLLVWISPFLLGMWLGGLRLDSSAVAKKMLLIGAVCGAVGWLAGEILTAWQGEPVAEDFGWNLLITAFGHSQMPLWLISSAGTSVMLIGALLLAIPALQTSQGRTKPLIHSVLGVLTSAGTLALSIYVLHLLVLSLLPPIDESTTGTAISIGMTLLLTGLGVLWQLRFTRGPLEQLMRLPHQNRQQRTAPDITTGDLKK